METAGKVGRHTRLALSHTHTHTDSHSHTHTRTRWKQIPAVLLLILVGSADSLPSFLPSLCVCVCVRVCPRVRVPVTSGASSLELTSGVYIRPVTRLTQGAVCVSFSSGSPSWSSSTPACGTSSPWGRATRRPSPVSTPSHHLLSLTLRPLSLSVFIFLLVTHPFCPVVQVEGSCFYICVLPLGKTAVRHREVAMLTRLLTSQRSCRVFFLFVYVPLFVLGVFFLRAIESPR